MGVEKEDGQSEHCICQLKSTDAMSISVRQKDLRILEYNASVSHKTPVFAIQFINTGEVWVMTKPEHLNALQDIVEGRKPEEKSVDFLQEQCYNKEVLEEQDNTNGILKSKKNLSKSLKARQRFAEQQREEAEQREKEFKTKQRERRNNGRKKIK